ncbi:toll/interleukin-1 receptor domain-containing protein [Methylobacterium marchantiae]|uniref:Toll/interleukin-1 receptor domain-containing protein n=1 Tax=Methylobacterium marchantiae TaxID=600331 RepID=A0ABW3WY16_9HYPH|nr:hypothetical protein AIGOOFII_2958 [Methylobacterium marchantiae]
MIDFFISYNSADVQWAEWIGFALEEKGFTTIIQAWDFRPGSNFVIQMQEAATKAERTIMVLSPDYLTSQFAAPEWAAAFAQDPQGLNQKLVPVMVRACRPMGLLPQIVQIRIMDMDEAAARAALLQGVDRKRAKPSSPPSFPGMASIKPTKSFPGATSAEAASSAARPASNLIPSLKRAPSDLDKRRFITGGFNTIKGVFEANLKQVEQDEPRIQTDFQLRSNTDFRAELFLDEKSKCSCRIWQGGMMSTDGINYAEGRSHSDNSCNEIISLAEGGQLALMAIMAMGHHSFEKEFNLRNMTPEQTADYLWRRFVSALRY